MDVPVVLLVEGYQAPVRSLDSYVATRVYIDQAAFSTPPTAVELPVIGDSWDVIYLGLRVISITPSIVSPGCDTINKYIVEYSTGSQQLEEDEQYPVTIQQSAEYVTYSDSEQEKSGTGHWSWPDGDPATDLKIRKREVTTTVTITRKIRASTYESFLKFSSKLVGKVNTDANFATSTTGITFPLRSVLYTGHTSSQTEDIDGRKIWQIQMTFILKDPGGGWADDGWNKAYRPSTNTYAIPTFSIDGSKLYEAAEFKDLFKSKDSYETP
jgi:hypothetical protein